MTTVDPVEATIPPGPRAPPGARLPGVERGRPTPPRRPRRTTRRARPRSAVQQHLGRPRPGPDRRAGAARSGRRDARCRSARRAPRAAAVRAEFDGRERRRRSAPAAAEDQRHPVLRLPDVPRPVRERLARSAAADGRASPPAGRRAGASASHSAPSPAGRSPSGSAQRSSPANDPGPPPPAKRSPNRSAPRRARDAAPERCAGSPHRRRRSHRRRRASAAAAWPRGERASR